MNAELSSIVIYKITIILLEPLWCYRYVSTLGGSPHTQCHNIFSRKSKRNASVYVDSNNETPPPQLCIHGTVNSLMFARDLFGELSLNRKNKYPEI